MKFTSTVVALAAVASVSAGALTSSQKAAVQDSIAQLTSFSDLVSQDSNAINIPNLSDLVEQIANIVNNLGLALGGTKPYPPTK